jgi:hypothetical protein
MLPISLPFPPIFGMNIATIPTNLFTKPRHKDKTMKKLAVVLVLVQLLLLID